MTSSFLCCLFVMFLTRSLCLAQDCSDPGTITNGVKTGTDYTDGSSVSYSCTGGYDLSGSVSVTCTTGSWSALPSCVIRDCGSLGTPSNAQVASGSATTYGSSITHSCVTGYSNTGGNAQRNCQADGTWSGLDIVCTAGGGSDNESRVITANIFIITALVLFHGCFYG